jgi:hypothetical protein
VKGDRKEIDCEQGTAAWHKARIGIPTASKFADIVTSTGKATTGAARERYMMALLAERMTGELLSNFVTPAIERGTELEPRARAWYELETGKPVKQVGFVQFDTGAGMCGASPDGMAVDRGLEIKCPLPHTIIEQLLDDVPPAEYIMQCQAGMWICGVNQWDLVLYSGVSSIPNRIYSLKADEKIHAALDQHLTAFCAELDANEARLIEMGGRAVWRDTWAANAAQIMEG